MSKMRKHKKARLLTMDELQARPCEVDGVPALFHRWAEDDEGLLKFNANMRLEDMGPIHELYKEAGIITNACNLEVIRKTYALVEYLDGTVHMVAPELVTFKDKEGKT